MADAKIITYGELISATVDVVPDNVPVALSIEGSDGREYIRVISTESGERVVLGEGTGVAGFGIPVVIGPGDADANEFTVGNGSGQEIEFDIGGTNIIKSQHAANFQIGTHAAHTLELITASTARLHIDADGKIVTGGDTALPALCSAGGIHLLTGTQTGQTASGDADDLVIESTAAEQGINFLGASNTTRQRIQFGDTVNSGMGGISYSHNGDDMSFWNNGGARSFYFLEEGYVQVNTNTPAAMLVAKGNLGTTLANTGTSADHGATPKVINCTAHGLIKGAAVVLLSGNSAAEEVFTVDAVGSANQFTVDTNPTNATSSAAVRTDPTTFKLLTGDNATALEFTNRRQLAMEDGNENVSIGSTGTLGKATTGSNNVIIGSDAGPDLTTGGSNTAVGRQALSNVAATNHATVIGYQAVYNGTSIQDYTTAVGSSAGRNTGTGGTSRYGAFFGWTAGDAVTTGENNTCIGAAADAAATVNNQTAIGYAATSTVINEVVLGNASVAVIRPMSAGQCLVGRAGHEVSGMVGYGGGVLMGKASAVSSINQDEKILAQVFANSSSVLTIPANSYVTRMGITSTYNGDANAYSVSLNTGTATGESALGALTNSVERIGAGEADSRTSASTGSAADLAVAATSSHTKVTGITTEGFWTGANDLYVYVMTAGSGNANTGSGLNFKFGVFVEYIGID